MQYLAPNKLCIILRFNGKLDILTFLFVVQDTIVILRLTMDIQVNTIYIVKVQGDPKQKLLLQMAITLEICISEPKAKVCFLQLSK